VRSGAAPGLERYARPLGALALGALRLMLGTWLVALASGHGHSSLPGHVLTALYGGMQGP